MFTAAFDAWGIQIYVEDPCSETYWLEATVAIDKSSNVGELTIAALKEAAINHIGSPQGIISIRNTISGDQAIEILSDRSMRVYGWCYRFNGAIPEVLANQLYPQFATDEIRWFFGYASYQDGVWKDYCTPTLTTRPAFVCRNGLVGDGSVGDKLLP